MLPAEDTGQPPQTDTTQVRYGTDWLEVSRDTPDLQPEQSLPQLLATPPALAAGAAAAASPAASMLPPPPNRASADLGGITLIVNNAMGSLGLMGPILAFG